MSETYDLEGKSLLFLVKDVASIQAAVSFLQRRDMTTEIVTDLKEAIRRIEHNPPDFICISVNYPHPKIHTIPKVIEATFAVENILFSESPDRRASAILAKSNYKNLIYGTLTGPSLILKIRRILRERQNREEMERLNSLNREAREQQGESSEAVENQNSVKVHSQKDTSSDIIQISGQLSGQEYGNSAGRILDDDLSEAIQTQYGRTGTEGGYVVFNARAESAHPTTAQMLAAATDPSDPIVTGPEFVNRGSLIIQPGVRQRKGSPIIESKDRPGGSQIPLTPATAANTSDVGLIPMEPPASLGPLPPGSPNGTSSSLIMPNGEPQKAAPVTQSSNSQPKPAQATSSSSNSATHSNSSAVPAGQQKSSVIYPNFDKKDASGLITSEAAKSSPAAAVAAMESEKVALETLKQCMTAALTRTSRPPEMIEEIALLDTVAQLGLIPVNSEFLRGYVMIALAKETYMDEAFLNGFNAHFKASLFEQGKQFLMEDPLSIQLAPFEIQKLVQASSECSVGGQHLDSQVLVSFIRRDRVLPRIRSNTPEMAWIDVDEIPTETPLTFETFLHLPVNKKFIRYIKNGGRISKKQKQRLQKGAKDSLAIRQRDQEKYKTFFAENALAAEVKPYRKSEEE